jgi:hypothetical protein
LTFSAGGAIALSSCGYHVGGKADLVPKSIQTIAVPAFANPSIHYKLTDELPRAISREFIARTRFKIEQNPDVADAILHGTVNSVATFPTIYDPVSGKATSVQVAVYMSLLLVERSTGKVLYSNPNYSAKESFDIAASTIVSPGQTNSGTTVNDQISAHQFFDESGPAYDRLARDIARQVVSSVVENF